jgi:O-methyltransferase
MKLSLTRRLSPNTFAIVRPRRGTLAGAILRSIQGLAARRDLAIVRRVTDEVRRQGRDWPTDAETMIGAARLDNIEECIRRVVESAIPGDLIECGTWRGGAAIYMRAVLEACSDHQRVVWVADSFQGLPKPDLDRYPADRGDLLQYRDQLAVGLDEVKANFDRYGFLDERTRFLPGWFEDVLPGAPIDRLALLRIDADMYKSTIEALENLYPKLSVGGYVIIDDHGAMESCRRAVDDFRTRHAIVEPVESSDWTGVFWRKNA